MHQSLGAAVGAHKPLQSYKINFQEAKTTREERTHPGAVDLRREGPLQTQILTGARTASRSRSLDSHAQGQRGADLNSNRQSWRAKGEQHPEMVQMCTARVNSGPAPSFLSSLKKKKKKLKIKSPLL